MAMSALQGCSDVDSDSDAGRLLEAPKRSLLEAFRLGGLEPSEPEMFVSSPRLAVDGSNLLYVLHSTQGRVAVFGEDGRFLNWIGEGSGRGPGEFNSPRRLGILGDTVWIRNASPHHITLFQNDGTLIRTDPVTIGAAPGMMAPSQGISGYLREGRAWVEPDSPPTALEEGHIPLSSLELGTRRVDGLRDTILTYRSNRGRLRGLHFDPFPEPPFFAVAADGSGVALAEWTDARPDHLRLRVHNPDGSLRWEMELPVPTRANPRGELQGIVQDGRDRVRQMRERLLEMGLPPEGVPEVPTEAEMTKLVHLPTHRPPVRAVHLGVDGTVWLNLGEPGPAEQWVAIDQYDGILFRIELPEGATLGQGTRESVWYSEADELGVVWVVRAEVPGSTETTPL